MSGLFGKTQINNSAPKLGALRIQQSTQGIPIQLTYGATRVTPNMLWYGDFRAIAHTQTSEAGKGGGAEVTNTTYTYTVAVIFGLGEGPIGGDTSIFGTIWAGKERVPDSVSFNGFLDRNGEQGQAPWPYLVTNHPDEADGYSSTIYRASEAYNLGATDSLPNITFEVFALLTNGRNDVNPALILPDFLTSPQYGAGWDLGSIDDLSAFEEYCNEAGFAISPCYNEQRPAAEIVTELARIGNSAVVWSDGLLKVIPYADSPVGAFVPNLTVRYNLGYDDFLASGADPVKIRRRRPSDAFNAVQVECLNRDNDYNIYVAEAKDQASIDQYGERPMEPITMHAICDIDVARTVAQAILQRELYVRNQFEFELGWRFARLEPMDIVTITDPLLGLDGYLVRIISIDESESGKLRVVAEELSIGVSTPGVYNTQGSEGAVINTNVDPGDAATPVIFQPPVELSGVPQVWMAASGGEFWGGAEIWGSDDGITYAQVGTIVSKARYGVLTANFPAGSDPDTVNVLSVDMTVSGGTLTSATELQADALNTLSFVGTEDGGELIAYSTANLVAPDQYEMGNYIRRGQRCTVSEDHETGDWFLRLDETVAKMAIEPTRVGQTIFFKLVSFNLTGGGLQNITNVPVYEYVVQPLGVVVTNGALPDTIEANEVLCIAPNTQYLISGGITVLGTINCDGTLVVQ